MSCRRAHLAALAAAAVLLLLHALPRHLPAVPVPVPVPAAVVAVPAAPAAPAAPASVSTQEAAAGHNDTSPAPAPPAPPAPALPSQPRANSSSSSPTPRPPTTLLLRDVYEAGYERPHPELCPSLGARLRLLVLVTSAPSHSKARDAIRLTWGHYAARRDVALAFVLGAAPDAAVRGAVEREDELYGDVVVGRFRDSYANLTLKTVSMLEWTDTFCPRVRRLLKTDDDMFINVPRLLRFIDAHERITNTIWGKVVRKSLPKRTKKSKYYVSLQQYPLKVYPDFATGPAYLLSTDVIAGLLRLAPTQPYLPLEDVFVTGLLAARLGIKRVHASEFYNRKVAAQPCPLMRGIAVHMVRYHEQFDLWRKLLDGKAKCPDS